MSRTPFNIPCFIEVRDSAGQLVHSDDGKGYLDAQPIPAFMVTDTVQSFLDVQARQLDWYCGVGEDNPTKPMHPVAAAELRRRIKERTRDHPRKDVMIEAAYCDIPRGGDIESEKARIMAKLEAIDPIALLDMTDEQLASALRGDQIPKQLSVYQDVLDNEAEGEVQQIERDNGLGEVEPPLSPEEEAEQLEQVKELKRGCTPEQQAEMEQDLRQFSGSTEFFKWTAIAPRSVLTEGAKYVAERAGAFWLMDIIASYQHEAKVRGQSFQTWKLTVKDEVIFGKKYAARVVATNGNDGDRNIIAKQMIPYTDFPLDEITLYATKNELGGITIMLPGEY